MSNIDIVQSLDALARAIYNKNIQTMYPIGSIYMNKTDSTNPATLFGFGTWVAIEGRVVVGKAAAGTFATAGATGGAETVTLTTAQIPAHQHTMRAEFGAVASASFPPTNQTNMQMAGTSAGTRSPQTTPIDNGGGSGGAHNNLQPYVVAYMWERTA